MFFFNMSVLIQEKIMPSANTLSVPVALHSTQSAMGLLHTILLADVITRQDRPGM